MATAERLLRAATVEIDVVDPRSPAAQAALEQYFGELDERFPSGFDPGAAGAADAAPHCARPTARSSSCAATTTPIGCGGVQRIDADTGEIKRMWIHPDWRGLGLGGRLLTQLEAAAATLGRAPRRARHQRDAAEAITMYERAGYHPIDRYNDNPYAQRWFAKDLPAPPSPGE